MSTVNKRIADDILAGKYEDSKVVKIVQYTTPEGWQNNFGLISEGQPLDMYEASPFIIAPQLYWEKPL